MLGVCQALSWDFPQISHQYLLSALLHMNGTFVCVDVTDEESKAHKRGGPGVAYEGQERNVTPF